MRASTSCVFSRLLRSCRSTPRPFLAVHWPSSADHARAAIVGHRAGGLQAVARVLHAQVPALRFCGVSSMRQPHDRVTHSSKRTTSAGIRLSGRLPAGHFPLHCKDRGQRPASTLQDKPDARIFLPSKFSSAETPLEPMLSKSRDLDNPAPSSSQRYSDREYGNAQALSASGPQKTSVREPHYGRAGLDAAGTLDTSSSAHSSWDNPIGGSSP